MAHSTSVFCMTVDLWKFTNNSLNLSSMANSMNFIMIIHSTCTGTFSRGISNIEVLLMGFGHKENIHLFYCVPLVLRGRMYLNRRLGL